jgi:hypothetical protein
VKPDDLVVTILWNVNPFRGDKFEEVWRPHAANVIDYGASWWAFWRSNDDRLQFTQIAVFPDKRTWERYWFSEELSEARADASGLYQVPLLPTYHRVVDTGELAPVEAES